MCYQNKVKGTRMKYKQTQSQTAIDINKGQTKFGMCVCAGPAEPF